MLSVLPRPAATCHDTVSPSHCICGGMRRLFEWAAMLTWKEWYCLVWFKEKRLRQATKKNYSVYYRGDGVAEKTLA